jgi:hypothetical protein
VKSTEVYEVIRQVLGSWLVQISTTGRFAGCAVFVKGILPRIIDQLLIAAANSSSAKLVSLSFSKE